MMIDDPLIPITSVLVAALLPFAISLDQLTEKLIDLLCTVQDRIVALDVKIRSRFPSGTIAIQGDRQATWEYVYIVRAQFLWRKNLSEVARRDKLINGKYENVIRMSDYYICLVYWLVALIILCFLLWYAHSLGILTHREYEGILLLLSVVLPMVFLIPVVVAVRRNVKDYILLNRLRIYQDYIARRIERALW